MSTSALGLGARQRDTKVCLTSEAALDVVDVNLERNIRKEAEGDAARLRRATLGLDVPVDCAAIANEIGVQVLVASLKKITWGGLLMKPGEDPKIVVNRADGYLRQRLTCALELGHYLRRSAETNQYARVDLRGEPVNPGDESQDAYAREFAACLLMPKKDIGIFAELKMDDLEMALQFLVPREAMQLRMKDLGMPAPGLAVT